LFIGNKYINPLNAEINPICHLLALLGAHLILHVSRIRVKNNVITYKGDKIIIQVIFQTVLFNKVICLTIYVFGTDLFNLYMYIPECTETMLGTKTVKLNCAT